MPGAEQQTNIQIGVNASQFIDGIKAATQAAGQFEASIDKVNSTTQRTAQQITATASSFASWQRSMDPAARAVQGFNAELQRIQSFYSGGFLSSQNAVNAAIDQAAAKYRVAAQAASIAKDQFAAANKIPPPPTNAAPAQATEPTQTNPAVKGAASDYNDVAAAAASATKAEADVAEAAKNVQQSVEGAASAQKDANETIVQAAQSYDALDQKLHTLQMSLDPIYASQQKLATVQAEINGLLAAGGIDQAKANQLSEQATQQYNLQARAFQNLEAQLDPVAAKKQNLATIEKQLNSFVADGTTTQARATQLMQSAKQAYAEFGQGAKVTGQQVIIAADQIRQMSDQMISGGGFIRPMLMQVPVAIQMMGGFGNTIDYLKSKMATLLSYGGLAAIAGGIYLIGAAAENNARQIIALSNSLQGIAGVNAQTSAETVRAAARHLAATTSLGTQESQQAGAILAANPQFNQNATQQQLEDMLKTAQQFSVRFDETLQQSAQRINAIFADPLAAALKYADENMAGFTAQFIAHVQSLRNSGQSAQAAAEIMAKLGTALKDVNTQGTPLQAALKGLNETLTAIGQGGGNASNGLGTGLTNALAGAVGFVDTLLKDLDSLLTKMSDLGISAKTQGEILVGAFTLMGLQVTGLLGKITSLISMLSKLSGMSSAISAVTSAISGAGAAGAGAVAGAEGAAVAAGAEGAVGAAAVAALPIAAIVTAVIAAGGATIWAYFKNSAGQTDFQTQAAQAGFTPYKAGNYELQRYYNPRTGEDLSTEQMNQKLLGQTMADSFATKLDQWFSSHAPSWLGGGTSAPPTGTATQAPIAPLTTLPPQAQQYAPLFTAAEQKYPNLPPGLLASVAMRESAINPNIPDSKTGAGGMMQILPSTAEKPGYNITPITSAQRYDPAIAIDFAGHYLSELIKAKGSVAGAVTAYSGGGYTASPAFEGKQTTTAPPAATGAQYGPTSPQQDIEKILYGRGIGQGAPDLTGLGTTEQKQAINDYISRLETLKKSAGTTSDQIDALNKVEEEQRAALENLKTPYEKTIQQQQEQIKVDSTLNTADKQVLAAQQALIDQNRQMGKLAPTQAELAQVASNELQKLAAQYGNIVAGNEQQAVSQNKLAAAYAQGGAAVDKATNYQKAWNDVVGNSPTATEAQKVKIDALAKSYDDLSAAQKHAQAAQELVSQQSQARLLNVQEANLTASAKQQAVATAQAQAQEQALQKGYNAEDTAKLVQQSGANAARTVDVDREKAAWQSVDQAASTAIDDIGNGLETALSTGKWSDFANAGKQALSEISKMFIQLALLNPLKDLLTGGRANAPSLFDLFNNTSQSNNPLNAGAVASGTSLISGTGGSSSGGGSLLGGLGSIGGLFSKDGLFGSAGPLFGTSAATATNTALANLGGQFGPETAAQFAAAGGSTGGFFSGIGDALSGAWSWLTGLFHTGGVAGQIGGATRTVPASTFYGAIRYHSGGVVGVDKVRAPREEIMPDKITTLTPQMYRSQRWQNPKMYHSGGLAIDTSLPQRMTTDMLPPPLAHDEIPAILRRNELVLTQGQQRAVASRLGQPNARQPIINQNFTITTPNADSFRSSKSQVQAEMARAMIQATRRI